MCHFLLEREGDDGPTHEEKMDAIQRQFPKVKRWLDWWSAADVSSMLFPSRRAMLEDSPDTTNAQESMHRLYYMITYVSVAPPSLLRHNN
jgi:hypothetical protein